MKHSSATTYLLLTSCLLSSCGTVNDPELEFRRQLINDLRKACIEANGGLQMDAVDLYGGQLSVLCSTWAYQQARQALL
jgi:hypothetical protein